MFLTFLSAALALAATEESKRFGEVDGWSVNSRADGCYIAGDYDGASTSLLIHLDRKAQLTLLIADKAAKFAAAERDDYSIEIGYEQTMIPWDKLSGGENTKDGSGVISIAFDATESVKLRRNLQGAENFVLRRGGSKVADLDIGKNSAAFAMLDRCVAETKG